MMCINELDGSEEKRQDIMKHWNIDEIIFSQMTAYWGAMDETMKKELLQFAPVPELNGANEAVNSADPGVQCKNGKPKSMTYGARMMRFSRLCNNQSRVGKFWYEKVREMDCSEKIQWSSRCKVTGQAL
jgi:hypothetical protein